MAILTKNLAVLTDEGQTALVDLDYDNVALTLVAVHVTNPTARAIFVSGVVAKNGRSFSQTFAAGQTTTLNLPQNPANKLDITITPNGRINGVEYNVRFA